VTVVSTQCEKNVELTNDSGLHMIPAQLICELACGFESAVSLHVGDTCLDAKVFLNLLGQAIEKGTIITVRASGPDACDAVDAIVALVESEFDQDVAKRLREG